MGDKPAAKPDHKPPGRQMKRSGRHMKGSGRQASRKPDHKHPAWETNDKKWETNTFFHLSPSSFHFWSPRLGACGRVPGWLVSHFLSFVSHFFSFVRLGLVVGFAAGLSPTCFHLSPTSFHLSPTSFHCLPGWVLVVGFPAGLSPTSFPTFFICLPVLFIVSQAGCLWCWLVSHFLSYLPLLFICFPGWVLVVRFPAGLSPTSFHLSPSSLICLPGWVLVVGVPAGLSPTSFHLSPLPFICLPLLFHFLPILSFVSPGWCLWSGSQLACLPGDK